MAQSTKFPQPIWQPDKFTGTQFFNIFDKADLIAIHHRRQADDTTAVRP